MKQIDTTQVIDPSVLQPFTARSLKFLQDAQHENIAGVVNAIILANKGAYSLTVPYVISGCVVSAAGANITAGTIFYGGKFYETTAITGSINIPIQFVLTKTQDATADPLTFSDSSSKNVHDIYKYVATDTATPGTFNATDFVRFTTSNPIVGSHSATLTTITNTETTLINDTVLSADASGKAVITLNCEVQPAAGGGVTTYTVTFKIKINGSTVNTKTYTFLNDGAFHIIELKHYLATYTAGDIIKITGQNSIVASAAVNESDFFAEGFEMS